MKTLRVGVASLAEMKARTLAIAAGARKVSRGEPKLWLGSLEGLAKVLSPANRRLLQIIKHQQPHSLAELGQMSGRAVSNLSRTLASMERYGLVQRTKDKTGRLRITVRYEAVCVQVGLGDAASVAADALAGGRADRVGFEEAVEVWTRWHRGELAARIAAAFDVNVGRIYEVVHSKVHPNSKAVAERKLGGHITRLPRRAALSSAGRPRL
jgi:predicted transcriptional regulator